METALPVEYEGTSCRMSIRMPVAGVAILKIEGHDVGEFGQLPMSQLEQSLPDGHAAELFIDARHTKGASIEVSSEWAQWLGANRGRFSRISMVTGSKFVEVTAGFVRRFSALEDVMRLYTDADVFDDALRAALTDADGGV